jgi:outer membrane protein assembly factor BamD
MFKNQLSLSASVFIVLAIALGSCKSRYEKLRSSNDNAKKYSEAIKLYNNKEYKQALSLFEPLVMRYTCQQQSEDLYYYYAYTIYKLKDYTSARYQFKNIADTYPSSPLAEECRFMSAYCDYRGSQAFAFDQDNTSKAIGSLQYFINLYPKSDRVADAGKLIQNLRDKLEEKSYANSKLYFTIGDWLAAVVSVGNMLRDYPDTKYAEELKFLVIRAQYEYAYRSNEDRPVDRYNLDIGYARQFVEEYPDSKYLKEAKGYIRFCNERIAKSKNILAEAKFTAIRTWGNN